MRLLHVVNAYPTRHKKYRCLRRPRRRNTFATVVASHRLPFAVETPRSFSAPAIDAQRRRPRPSRLADYLFNRSSEGVGAPCRGGRAPATATAITKWYGLRARTAVSPRPRGRDPVAYVSPWSAR